MEVTPRVKVKGRAAEVWRRSAHLCAMSVRGLAWCNRSRNEPCIRGRSATKTWRERKGGMSARVARGGGGSGSEGGGE